MWLIFLVLKKEDVVRLIQGHLALFSDVPTCSNVLQHDIDVGHCAPIKQHPYRIIPIRHKLMKKEVEYLLKNGLGVPPVYLSQKLT